MYDNYFEPGLEDEISLLIGNYAKTNVNDIIERYAKAKSELDKIECQIKLKNNELKKLSDEVEAAESCNRDKIPKAYLDATIKAYTGGYAPGDIVYIVAMKYSQEECHLCKGKGKINVKYENSDIRVNCPECEGHGKKEKKSYYVKEDRVINIDFSLKFYKDKTRILKPDCIYIKYYEYAISAEKVFAEKEEAQKKADRLNGKS